MVFRFGMNLLPRPFAQPVRPQRPLKPNIPRGEFLEALLVVSLGTAYGSAEAAGRSGCCDQGRYGVNSAGTASLEATEAIGSEEARRLSARRNAQQ